MISQDVVNEVNQKIRELTDVLHKNKVRLFVHAVSEAHYLTPDDWGFAGEDCVPDDKVVCRTEFLEDCKEIAFVEHALEVTDIYLSFFKESEFEPS